MLFPLYFILVTHSLIWSQKCCQTQVPALTSPIYKTPFWLTLVACSPILWNFREYTRLRTCAPPWGTLGLKVMEFLAQTLLSLLPGPVRTSSLGCMHTRSLTVHVSRGGEEKGVDSRPVAGAGVGSPQPQMLQNSRILILGPGLQGRFESVGEQNICYVVLHQLDLQLLGI